MNKTKECIIAISIVVLNHNKRCDLKRNLSRLKDLKYSQYEVIVVDNNSTDGSREMVSNLFPEFQLICSNQNRGVSAGLNLGYRAAKGQFIISLDDDALPPSDICEKTKKAFDRDPRIGCLAFLIKQMPQGYFNNVANTEVLVSYHGAAHAFRREALVAIGYMDERFFFGAEEIDTSLRLHDAGYLTLYSPDVIVEHFPRQYSGAERLRRTSNWIAEWGWFYLKHFPFIQAGLCISRLILAHALNAIRMKFFVPFVAGIWKFAQGAPSILKERNIASRSTIKFYMSPNCEPSHFNKSVTRKLSENLYRRFGK